ncbi:MAG: ABC transporter permease [Melioribacteraceae bacterium]|nr:MAG: ABC transporter permease [Melioribacteraceae bacterium]
MKLLLKLAWRNIWRNKRRSILTLCAIIFATFASVAMRGMQIGTYELNISNAVNMFSGYIQIQKNGYRQNPSINKNFKYNNEIEEKINSVPGILGYAPRVYADGLISFKDNSLGAAVFGVDPQKEKSTTKFLDRVKEGKFFESHDTYEIVLGTKLMENLKAKIGDEIVILSQGYDGSLGNLKFKIIGTVKMGMQEFDASTAFIGLETAQELVAMYGRIHAIAIKADDITNVENIQNVLTQKLNDGNLAVLSWEEVMSDFKQSIELDNVSGIFMLLILITIVAFGILNTVLMSVTERFNEFGVTLSIGMPQMKLVSLVFIETFFLTLIGIVIGDIIGWFINYILILNPVEFGGELGKIYEEYGFLPRMESTNTISIFINTTLTILLVSMLSSIYPAYKTYKLEPLKGIRYT